MQEPMYTELDGAWHLIAENETTECGIPVPHGNGFVQEPDGKVHYGPLAPKKGKAKDADST